VQPNSKKTEHEVNQRIVRKVNSSVHERIFYLTNNLPYAEVIEFGGYSQGPKVKNGFSRQAPKGVVRVTAKSFSRIFNVNARRLNNL
jgi:hypothetical protein